MDQIKDVLVILFTKKFFKKTLAYFLIVLFIYLFRSFLWLFLMVFIFSYLFYTFWKYIKVKFDNFILTHCKVEQRQKIIKRIISVNLIIIFEYIIFVWFLIYLISDLLPQLITELSTLNSQIPFIWEQINLITTKMQDFMSFNSKLWLTITQVIESKDYEVIINILRQLKTAWIYFFQFIISLILSFVFVIDRKKLTKYLYWIKKSSFSFLYKEYSIIMEKIVKSFWLILKAQSMIAWINALLTIVWLFVIWLVHGWTFPFLLTLWLFVFLAWFIPVLWVFISSVPIIFIAYSFIWGYWVVIEIIFLILIIHTIEAYYLNPKIVSKFFELPVSLTFLILIMSEHLFWIAWLLIWVSIFYFITWLLVDIDKLIVKKNKEIKKQKVLTKK